MSTFYELQQQIAEKAVHKSLKPIFHYMDQKKIPLRFSKMCVTELLEGISRNPGRWFCTILKKNVKFNLK